ncbi:hypothetical protein H7100_03105, partial [Candidatus Saccharibacteria bacterium]|nr:hypothetical protein [Candidatus Saccharibacteria bacterium]
MSKLHQAVCGQGGTVKQYHHLEQVGSKGAKKRQFLLSIMLVTVLVSGLLSGNAHAQLPSDMPNTPTGCLLNIGTCLPDTNPDGTTGTGNQTTDPGTPTNPQDPVDPDPIDPAPPVDDGLDPVLTLKADTGYPQNALLAGGNYSSVFISATIDDKHLASYSLKLNGTVIDKTDAATDTSVTISTAWSVSSPNVLPSGIYVLTLDAVDTSGRQSHSELAIEVDNDAPDLTVIGGGYIVKSGSISPKTTTVDAHAITAYIWTANANNPDELVFDRYAAQPVFTPTVEGSYAFSLAVTDELGNIAGATFDFDYAQELEVVPLPITADPTDTLVDKSPSTIATKPLVNSGLVSSRDSLSSSDDNGVLGTTRSTTGLTVPTEIIGTIAPTSGGWSVFGVLWYWWVVVI